MKVSNNYIVVKKLREPETDGFKTIEVQDSFVYKGQVTHIPEAPVYIGNEPVSVGSIVVFAKYSPDTHEIEVEGEMLKFVKTTEILGLL